MVELQRTDGEAETAQLRWDSNPPKLRLGLEPTGWDSNPESTVI